MAERPLEVRMKIAEAIRQHWRRLTPEDRLEIAKKRSLGAKRMWRGRSQRERKLIGQKISATKRKGEANGEG